MVDLRSRGCAWLVVVVGATAGGGCDTGPANCSTNQAVYAEEGPDMSPGGDCIGCHASGEGPVYTIAGTVMGRANDDEDCAGISNATVEITDANGDVFDLPTTRDGNFFYGGRGEEDRPVSSKPIVFPFTAKVIRDGRVRAMVAPQSDGDCATCHTAKGANGAPGRILAP